MLTISPKTGSRIGVSIREPGSNAGMRLDGQPMTPTSQFMSPRASQGRPTLKGNKTQGLLNSYLVSRVKGEAAARRGRDGMSRLPTGPYSANKAFNLTFKTQPSATSQGYLGPQHPASSGQVAGLAVNKQTSLAIS